MPLPAPGWSGYFQQHQAPIADEWPHDQYQQQEDVDAPLTCDDYYDLKDQCDDLHRQLAECTSAREAAEQESEQLRCEKGHLALRATSAESNIRRVDQQLAAEKEARRKAEKALKEAEARFESEAQNRGVHSPGRVRLEGQLSTLHQELDAERASGEQAASEAAERVQQLTCQLSDAQSARDALQQKLAEQTDRAPTDDSEQSQLRRELAEQKQAALEAQHNLAQLQQTHQETHTENRSLQMQIQTLRDENRQLTSHRDGAQKLSALASEMGELPALSASEVMILQEENRELRAKNQELTNQLREEKLEYQRLEQTVRQQKDMKKRISEEAAKTGQLMADAKAKLSQLAQRSSKPPAAAQESPPTFGVTHSISPRVSLGATSLATPVAKSPSVTPKQLVSASPASPWITVASCIRIVSASSQEPESLVIQNQGDSPVDLEGYCIVDHVGKPKPSNRFAFIAGKHNPGPFVLGAGESMVFWFSTPRTEDFDKQGKTSPFHVYAVHPSGSLCKTAMLTDVNDTIILKDTKGRVVSEIIPGTCTLASHQKALDQVSTSSAQTQPLSTSKKATSPGSTVKASPVKATTPVSTPKLHLSSVTAQDPEQLVIVNQGKGQVDLEGYSIVDNLNRKTKSNQFVIKAGKANPGPFILEPGASMTFWFSPMRTPGFDTDGKCNPHHFFATNKNGTLRKAAVVNDDGDTIALKDPKGSVVAEIVTSKQQAVENTVKVGAKRSKPDKQEKKRGIDKIDYTKMTLTSWTVAKLKEELSSHGADTSGKKAELIARLEGLSGNAEEPKQSSHPKKRTRR